METINITKVLIANRGEIAVRVIRACKVLGLRTVAIYSDPDENALHVQLADEAYRVGPAPASASYLNIANIIDIARRSGADAVHPGYGFLSEKSAFARAVVEAGLVFVGPTPENIELMGDKANALKFVQSLGVPTIKGSGGVISHVKDALAVAQKVGLPLLIKAAAGGGGRGMRVVSRYEDLEKEFAVAQREARGAFGDDNVYLEQFLYRPRHVEVQILGDGTGSVTALGERDCSLQRRNQKLVEESPCIALSSDQRQRLLDSAAAVGRAVCYKGAGTVEFLVEGDHFYFIEMNTRIQVEHPVTEWVTGIDLVMEQLLIAAGSRRLDMISPAVSGHSIECRINAEDADNGFMPSPGTVRDLRLPGGPGVRVDTALYEGASVPPYYDSLIAKLCVWGNSRAQALQRMHAALGEFSCSGVKTTASYLQKLIDEPDVRQGIFDTQYLARRWVERTKGEPQGALSEQS